MTTDSPQSNPLESAILRHLRENPGAVNFAIRDAVRGLQIIAGDPVRAVDRALQRLRRTGVVEFAKDTGWRVKA